MILKRWILFFIIFYGITAFGQTNLECFRIEDKVLLFYGCTDTAVTIPEEIEEIGAGAFQFRDLTKVTLNKGLKKIDHSAFRNNNIEQLTIPSGVNFIGEKAFLGNPIKKVSVDENLLSMFSDSFEEGVEITLGVSLKTNYLSDENRNYFKLIDRVVLHKNVKDLPDGIFREDVYIIGHAPEVVNLGKEYFANKNILSEIILPSRVESILKEAFLGAKLQKVIFNKGLEYIGEKAFYKNQITTVDLPDSVMGIGPGAFQLNQIESLSLSSKIRAIPENCFSGNKLESVDLVNIEVLGDRAFQSNPISNLKLSPKLKKMGKLVFTGARIGPLSLTPNLKIITYKSFKNAGITKLTISEGISKIEDEAFSGNKLVELVTPRSVVEIGASAFENNLIESLDIQGPLVSIPPKAFYKNKIKTIAIPETLIRIESQAFAKNPEIRIVFHDKITFLGNNAFDETADLIASVPPTVSDFRKWFDERPSIHSFITTYRITEETGGNLKGFSLDTGKPRRFELVISEGVTHLKKNPHWSRAITRVVFPKSLKSIAAGVFDYGDEEKECSYFPDVKPNFCFSGDTKLVGHLEIPDGVEVIGESAFRNQSLTSINLPDSLRAIEPKSFYKNSLEKLSLPEHVTKIGHSAFQENKIKEVQWPLKLETIGNNAFKYNQMPTLELPKTVYSVGDGAFSVKNTFEFSNPFIESFVIGENFKYIGDAAFSGYHFGKVHLETDKIKWGQNKEKYGESRFKRIDELFIKEGLTKIGDYAFFGVIMPIDNIHLPLSLLEIGKSAFLGGNYQPSTLDLSSFHNLRIIGDGAFANNSLEQVILPSGLVSLSGFGYNPLKTLKIPSGVKFIGEINKTRITDLYIPGSVKVAKGFANSYDLKRVTIAEGVEIIGNRAFYNSCLVEVVLPKTVTTIGDEAFAVDQHCGSIFSKHEKLNITLTEGLNYIGQKAFWRRKMTSRSGVLSLPGNLIEIGRRAFAAGIINRIEFSKGPKRIGTAAFENSGITGDLILPEGIEQIEPLAFSANKLDSVILEGGNPRIEERAFAESSIRHVKLPSSLKEIGKKSFAANPIVSLVIEDGVEMIGESAFNSNRGSGGAPYLSLEIPSSVKVIGKDAFATANVKELILNEGLEIIGVGAFSRNKIEKLIIPEGVRVIEDYAFSTNLISELSLPESIEEFGNGVFENNPVESELGN